MRLVSGLLAALALAGVAAAGASASNVSVGSGAALDLGTGSLDLGCADLDVGGTLAAGSVGFAQGRDVTIEPSGVVQGESATLEVAGDWDNAGSFVPGSSTVRLVDGCALLSGVVAGDTTFANLELVSTSSKLVSFTAGSTQTVGGTFLAQGESGALLQIRSTVGGSEAFLVALGPASASFVDVMDNDATGGNPIPLDAGSTKGSNTPGWILAFAIPLLPAWGAGLMAVLLAAAGGRLVRRIRP